MKSDQTTPPGFLRIGWRIFLIFLTGAAAPLAMWLVFSSRIDAHWTEYREEAAQRGQTLSLPALAAPIPAEENLAGAPPFAPVAVDEKLEPKEPPVLKADWLPKALLPDLKKFARTDFAAARAELAAEGAALPEADEALAATVLRLSDEKMAEWWPRVLAAEAKPQARFGIQSWPWPPQAKKLPSLNMRVAQQVHAVRALAFLRTGRGAAALAEIHGSLRLANSLTADPSLIALMMRTAAVGWQTHVIWEGLAERGWSESELAALDRELATLSVSAGWARAMDVERGWQNGLYEAMAEGSLGERAHWMQIGFGTSTVSSLLLALGAQRPLVRDNQLLANRHFDAVRQRFDAAGNWHEVESPFVFENLTSQEKMHYALASLSLAGFEKAERRLRGVETLVRQARIAVALERYRQSGGHYPDELAELPPALMVEIPVDPADGEPMGYETDGPNSYRLWSIAVDDEDSESPAEFALVWPGGTQSNEPLAKAR